MIDGSSDGKSPLGATTLVLLPPGPSTPPRRRSGSRTGQHANNGTEPDVPCRDRPGGAAGLLPRAPNGTTWGVAYSKPGGYPPKRRIAEPARASGIGKDEWGGSSVEDVTVSVSVGGYDDSEDINVRPRSNWGTTTVHEQPRYRPSNLLPRGRGRKLHPARRSPSGAVTCRRHRAVGRRVPHARQRTADQYRNERVVRLHVVRALL